MNTGTRLGLYVAVLGVVFGTAFATADAVVPESALKSWTTAARGHQMTTVDVVRASAGHGGHASTDQADTPAAGTAEVLVNGVTSTRDGYLLSPITVPDEVGQIGTLSFQIRDTHGKAQTSFATQHDKKLHLIVVRTDGTQFRHLHPTMAADGTWSLPWGWTSAGTYRLYADFLPEADAATSVTLTRTVDVAGTFAPVTARPAGSASVDGFTVHLTGDLVAGSRSALTLTVHREGKPVTALQPYLGAFGHLVALRQGDLAYLHVHPQGDEPAAGQLSGPRVEFAAQAPTPGRYLMYLDFRVDGQVHSAPFVVDTTTSGAAPAITASPAPPHDGHDH